MHHIDEEKEAKRYFHHEKLDAYRVVREATRFIAVRRAKLRGLPGQAGPQLERAIVGAQTNLCAAAAQEGAEKRRQFRIALSEASEAGGAIDIAFDFGALSEEERRCIRSLLLRLCAMLNGLAK